MNKGGFGGGDDLGELDQALFLYLEGQERSANGEKRQTLNIFPSQPMHVEPSGKGGLAKASAASAQQRRPSKAGMEQRNPNSSKEAHPPLKMEAGKKGSTSSSEQETPKTPDAKTLRRLAQNREAARKSRLRKKAYIQQLESSRIKLTQLEQELQRARNQGGFFAGAAILGEQAHPLNSGAISSEAAAFDMEYARWLEDHSRLMCDLRAAMQEQSSEAELKMFVDGGLAHFDQLMALKAMAAKSDVFHLVSGMWMTPAERCFMWLGGFRPSDLIKVLVGHIEPLSEQQILAIYALRTSTQETEDALSQGLEALHQSLSATIASDELTSPSNMANYMGHMAIAMNKLSTLEGFVRQADNLRQQTLHRLHHILTTRQAARCFLAIAEYFHRLRALSSLWLARPRQD